MGSQGLGVIRVMIPYTETFRSVSPAVIREWRRIDATPAVPPPRAQRANGVTYAGSEYRRQPVSLEN